MRDEGGRKGRRERAKANTPPGKQVAAAAVAPATITAAATAAIRH